MCGNSFPISEACPYALFLFGMSQKGLLHTPCASLRWLAWALVIALEALYQALHKALGPVFFVGFTAAGSTSFGGPVLCMVIGYG